MIEFTSYASGSGGNLYTIEDGETKLLLEAGLSWKNVRQLLDFRTHELDGCLSSHFHGDHSKGIADVMKAGIPVYANTEVFEHYGLLDHHRAHVIKAREQFKINTFTIMPFDVDHDVPNLGFLFCNKEGERFAYITDGPYSRYRFNNLVGVAIEVNFDKQTLKENLRQGVVDSYLYQRLLKTHLGLETAVEFFRQNDLSKLREVRVLHISDRNANEERIKKAIQAVTGVPVMIAGGE